MLSKEQLPVEAPLKKRHSYQTDDTAATRNESGPDSNDESNSSSDKAFIGSYDEYPEDIRDNDHIRYGYRINYKGFWPILRSAFDWHNETVNVWTHFLGSCTFICILYYIITAFPVTKGTSAMTQLLRDGKNMTLE